MTNVLRSAGLFLCCAFIFSAWGGEQSDAPPKLTPAELEKLKTYSDSDAGYSMRIPAGYERLTEDESREVFRSMSEVLGKEAGARVLRRPPAFFKGPSGSNDPKVKPPVIGVAYTELDEPVDPSQMSYYKEKTEEFYRQKGDKFGDVKVSLVSVDGISSLRVEMDTVSPADNSREHTIKISTPGNGRRYEIDFTFSPDQAAKIEAAEETVLRTFKINNHPSLDPETKSRWTRIAIWTVGGFALGIVLSLLLKVLSGAGETAPEQPS